MSPPRPVFSDSTYLVSRRCSERRLFLKPGEFVADTFVFVLALASQRTGVLVHAICVMGNHYHAVVTDPEDRIPEFHHYLHEFTAKVLNKARARSENLWSVSETSRVRLEDEEAVIAKVVYTVLNPVLSYLVASARKWPGLCKWWKEKEVTVCRPPYFFSEKGTTPEKATLRLVPPPQLAHLKDGGIALVSEHIEKCETSFQRRARRSGKKFVGLANLRNQKWWESPRTFAERRGLRPQVATRNKARRIEAINRNKEFIAAYAHARRQWLEGRRDVVWPAGTYQMRVFHGVRCADAPT